MHRMRINKLSITTLSVAIIMTAIGLMFVSFSSKSYAAPSYQAVCSFNNVPSSLAVGASMTPTLTIANTGVGTISPHMISFVATTDGPTTYFKEKSFGHIVPGQVKTLKLGKYTVQPGTPAGKADVFSRSDLNFNGTKISFYCEEDFSVIN